MVLPKKPEPVLTWRRPSSVRGMVTHLVGWAPLVVMAVINESSSSLFSLSFLTRDSMALLEKASLSPPCRWHMRLCTMDKQASALVGATEDILAFCCWLVDTIVLWSFTGRALLWTLMLSCGH